MIFLLKIDFHDCIGGFDIYGQAPQGAKQTGNTEEDPRISPGVFALPRYQIPDQQSDKDQEYRNDQDEHTEQQHEPDEYSRQPQAEGFFRIG